MLLWKSGAGLQVRSRSFWLPHGLPGKQSWEMWWQLEDECVQVAWLATVGWKTVPNGTEWCQDQYVLTFTHIDISVDLNVCFLTGVKCEADLCHTSNSTCDVCSAEIHENWKARWVIWDWELATSDELCSILRQDRLLWWQWCYVRNTRRDQVSPLWKSRARLHPRRRLFVGQGEVRNVLFWSR